jgi:hypothetical protein
MPDGLSAAPALAIAPMLPKDSSRLGADKFENPVVLFPNEWTVRYFREKTPH